MLGSMTSWACLLLGVAASAPADECDMTVLRIWDRAAHNAFTDLVRDGNEWLCVFREGTGHVSHDGKVRVLASPDGERWTSRALLTTPDANRPDLRDPKLAHTPDGKWMLTALAVNRKVARHRRQTFAWFSRDGRDWGRAVPIGEPGWWLWRVTWHDGVAWSVGYNRKWVRLFRSSDGRRFRTAYALDSVPESSSGYPNEATLRFAPDGRMLCLLRREGSPNTALLGIAPRPGGTWTWKDLGARLGGPEMLRLPDGRWIVAGRRYDGGTRTSLMWLDMREGRLREFARPPSGGDTSYPALVHHDGSLWMSYYSSHEGKAAIYFANLPLPAATPSD